MTPIKFCDQLLDIWRVLPNEAGASIWELSLKNGSFRSLARYVAKLNAARPKS